jgi:hypothetical protein
MRILFPTLVAVFVFGCADEPTATLTEPAGLPVVEDGSVRAAVFVSGSNADITVVRVEIDAQSLDVGAYQGRFTYDPAAMDFIDASMPKDGYRVINTGGADEGLIRFAGFTVQRFESPIVLELAFHVRDLTALDELSVDLDVVGSVEGVAVAEDRILEPKIERVVQ